MKTAILSAWAVMAVAMLVQAQPATNAVANAGNEICTTVTFTNLPARDAVTALARQAGLNVLFDPALAGQAGPNVNVKWHNVTALQGLQALLENHGWQMTKKSGLIVRISAKSPATAGSRWQPVDWSDNAPTNGAAGDTVLDPIAFDGVPLPDAIRALALQAGLNILFDPKLLAANGPDGRPVPVASPSITVKFRQLTARQALIAILDNWDWQATQIPNNPILRVTTGKTGQARVGSPAGIANLWENAPTNGAAGNTVLPIDFRGIPLLDAVRALAAEAELNVVFDPRLIAGQDTPTVTLKWKNLTVRQALQKLLDTYGWQATQIPGSPLIRIVAKNP